MKSGSQAKANAATSAEEPARAKREAGLEKRARKAGLEKRARKAGLKKKRNKNYGIFG